MAPKHPDLNPNDPFLKLAPAAKRLAEARTAVDRAQRDFERAIVAARKSGWTLASIAEEAGITTARVFQITNKAKSN